MLFYFCNLEIWLMDYILIFILIYFFYIVGLLQRGEMFKEWDKIIEEIVYFIIFRFEKFQLRGVYEDF